jgi:hypothetical protein
MQRLFVGGMDVQPLRLRGCCVAFPGVALRFTPGYWRAALRAAGVRERVRQISEFRFQI